MMLEYKSTLKVVLEEGLDIFLFLWVHLRQSLFYCSPPLWSLSTEAAESKYISSDEEENNDGDYDDSGVDSDDSNSSIDSYEENKENEDSKENSREDETKLQEYINSRK